MTETMRSIGGTYEPWNQMIDHFLSINFEPSFHQNAKYCTNEGKLRITLTVIPVIKK